MVITIKLINPRLTDEIICWVLAILMHSLLLFWQVSPIGDREIRNPIISIDYISEEIGPPLPAYREKKGLSLAGKIKSFFKKAEPPKKEESELAGKIDTSLKPIKITEKIIKPKGKLIAKNGSISNFNFKGKSAQQELAMTEDQIAFATKHAEEITEKQARKLESRSYSVASGDLPFQVSKAEGISQGGGDIALISTGKTSKNIGTTKKMLVPKVKSSRMQGKTFGTEKIGGGFGTEGLSSDSMDSRFTGGISEGDLSGGDGVGGTGAQTGGSGSSGGKDGGGKYGGIFKTTGGGTGGGGWSSIKEEIEAEEVRSKKQSEEKVIRRTAAKKRTLFEIVGPLANREILDKVVPKYPEWAKRQGVDAAVSLHFVVLSNGKVKKNIYVQRTSGYSRLDQLVTNALSQWVFVALEKKFYGKEQWGVITFYFNLK
ncbi:energy transducer TonB [bacterium]|nr:energy transducer TonB [bacterium]